MPPIEDFTGRQVNAWTVLEYFGQNSQKRSLWKCQCVCGKVQLLEHWNLANGFSKSCGCLLAAPRPRGRVQHGEGDQSTAEYRAWKAMKMRCYQPNYKSYDIYGGRGIRVCDAWLHCYPQFLKDMGRKPSPDHSLDRVNSDGHYCKDNCRWATRSEQNKNRDYYRRKKLKGG